MINPLTSFRTPRSGDPDEFVGNEFGQPQVGPKGKAHGRALQSAQQLPERADSGFRAEARPRNDEKFEALPDPESRCVLRIAEVGFDTCMELLACHGLQLIRVEDGAPIPGSYWGECEAGVIGESVYARSDTPLHSLLHEACHLLVLDPERRASVHTDASDSQIEEDATCYLQIVLADALPGFGRARALADMDAWGYTFRLGSARAWFECDAEDARAFLAQRGLLPPL